MLKRLKRKAGEGEGEREGEREGLRRNTERLTHAKVLRLLLFFPEEKDIKVMRERGGHS